MRKEFISKWLGVLAVMGAVLVMLMSLANAASIKVIATVDGIPITDHDLAARRNMLIQITGLELTPETRAQIDRDVLQMLIDDTIKISAGTALFADRLEAIDANADQLVDSTFSQNNENPDAVLARLGIPRAVIHKKFKADILWASIINGRFQSQFANAPAEAELELARLQQNLQAPHINLEEIILLPAPGRNYAATLNLAQQMVRAIRNGADFRRIAQQYSAAGNASTGGRVGWVLESRLETPVRKVLAPLTAGDITNPIERDGAVIIYRVVGKRAGGNANPLEAEVRLGRLFYPMRATDDASRLEAAAKLTRDTRTISSCAALEHLHQDYGSDLPFGLGVTPLVNLAANLRGLIAPLEAGEMTQPVSFAEGMAVFMVCEKTLPETSLPSAEELTQNIQNRYFSILSNRHLNQLRREAVIDIRVAE